MNDALDRLVPLESGSFSDVAELGFDIPMRYAECFAMLCDGKKVRLKDKRQLLGWSGRKHNRSFYFRVENTIVCVRTNSPHRTPVRLVEIWDRRETVPALSASDLRIAEMGVSAQQITTVDGSLLFIVPSEQSGEEVVHVGARAGKNREFASALAG